MAILAKCCVTAAAAAAAAGNQKVFTPTCRSPVQVHEIFLLMAVFTGFHSHDDSRADSFGRATSDQATTSNLTIMISYVIPQYFSYQLRYKKHEGTVTCASSAVYGACSCALQF